MRDDITLYRAASSSADRPDLLDELKDLLERREEQLQTELERFALQLNEGNHVNLNTYCDLEDVQFMLWLTREWGRDVHTLTSADVLDDYLLTRVLGTEVRRTSANLMDILINQMTRPVKASRTSTLNAIRRALGATVDNARQSASSASSKLLGRSRARTTGSAPAIAAAPASAADPPMWQPRFSPVATTHASGSRDVATHASGSRDGATPASGPRDVQRQWLEAQEAGEEAQEAGEEAQEAGEPPWLREAAELLGHVSPASRHGTYTETPYFVQSRL